MATIIKDGNHWLVRWNEYDKSGQRHTRKKQFDTKAAAKEFELAVENGEVQRIDQRITFEKYARQWFDLYQHDIEHSTYGSYKLTMERAITYFGNRELQSIHVLDVEAYYKLLMQPNNGITRKPLCANSVHRHHATLRLIFAYAERDELISTNPAAKARLPKIPEKELPQPDIEAVKERIAELHGTPYFTAVCIALYAGLRRSEICGLKWGDIDFEAETMTVRRVREYYRDKVPLNEHTYKLDGQQIIRESTKSGHIRTFTMPHALTLILKEELHNQGINRLKFGEDYNHTGFVCVYELGTPINENKLTLQMKGVCRLHDLRHLNVTYQIDAGIPITEIARRAGHTTTQTTLKVYAHALVKQDKAAADALNTAFGQV